MQPPAKDQYREYRNRLLSFVKEDIVGPGAADEIIADKPTWRYATGMLFPQEDVAAGDGSSTEKEDETFAEEELGASMEKTSSYFPSAMGVSFLLNKRCKSVRIAVRAGRYLPMKPEDYHRVARPLADLPLGVANDPLFQEKMDYKEGFLTLKAPISTEEASRIRKQCGEHKASDQAIKMLSNLLNDGWRREEISFADDVQISSGKPIAIDDCLALVCTVRESGGGLNLCTISLVNTAKSAKPQSDNASSRFQIYMDIAPQPGESFIDFAQSQSPDFGDPEEGSLELLYRNRRTFAAGHGCSADWQQSEDGATATRIWTDAFPAFEIPQTMFTLPHEHPDLEKPDLHISFFAGSGDSEIVGSLEKLAALYGRWIEDIGKDAEGLDDHLRKIAHRHIDGCKEAHRRIAEGIGLLRDDADCMRAFKLANKAMLMQRCQARLQKEPRFPDDPPRGKADYESADDEWRPFQIAFLLLNLESIAKPDSQYRETVDLIWFPTGGGKTEAYLALTAFTIFLRRIRNPQDASGGTTVIMRYTLRLLTSQQFQRASTLICACELIRKEQEDLGGDEITIGLWLGGSSTPNTIADAEYRIRELRNHYSGAAGNPFQVLACPWCGTHMVKRDGRGVDCFEIRSKPRKHLTMWCPADECDFHGGLPVKVVDQDIYHEPTTLLFGTVDKFANLPWLQDASSIFALDEGNANPSPELIIQDELHLISGALGTIVGLYETALDMLCSHKGVKPKIIASTATVRRAKEQCRALYARDLKQFPPPGIDASDSFFARESDISKQTPGRLYVGVMPAGKTSTTMQVRLMADCIQGAGLLEGEDAVRDPYWTQVVYCNSIRELGKSKTIVYDDVQEHSLTVCQRIGRQLQPRYFKDKAVRELTSRVPSGEIPAILQQLFKGLPDKDKAIDILLATNMISVGVDVDRLGLMTIIGQPKTTSEYIQASSRVGRKYPGLVFTLFSSVKSRDRSHYEQFRKYHQSIYRHVEPTSVTPFSAPARDKALHAVLLTLIRHLLGHRRNEDLPRIDVASPEVDKMVRQLMDRVAYISDNEKEIEATEMEIRNLLDEINGIVHRAGATYGGSKVPEKNALMRSAESDRGGQFRTLRSMRSTDAECLVLVKGVQIDKDESKRPSLRRSQCITTFGIGAIADLANGSVMMMGIDHWPTRPCPKLVDERLEEKLHASFLLMPPDKEESATEGVPAVRFPRWMRCRACKSLRTVDEWRARWNRKGDFDKEPRCDVHPYIVLIPSRFIVACHQGHIDDFPYNEWVHRGKPCPNPQLEYSKSGASAALSGIWISCRSCDAKPRSMGEAFDKDSVALVAKCKGAKPWMNSWEGACGAELTTLQRGSTNVHFPIIKSSILIPPYTSENLKSKILSSTIWERYDLGLNAVDTSKDEEIRDFARAIHMEIGDDVAEIFKIIKPVMTKTEKESVLAKDDEEDYRYPEFMAFRGHFKREECNERDFLIEKHDPGEYSIPGMSQIVLVKKLKETRVQTGFTRIKPPFAGNEEAEDDEPVKAVSVSADPRIRWYPGYEVRGEGIFIELSPDSVERWVSSRAVAARLSPLEKRFSKNPDKYGVVTKLTPAFILLHSLSHALIRQLSFECGYSSSSLRERIYCSSPDRKNEKMYGILIYTAEGDSDGTMGGLVRQAEPHLFTRTFYEAIRASQWCSSDPLCIGCLGQGFNAMSLGACHACAMLPETSCETMNRYLDRAVLVGSMDEKEIGYFSDWFAKVTRTGKP